MDNAGASVSILSLSCKKFRGYRKMSETTSNGNLEYHQFLTVTEEQEWPYTQMRFCRFELYRFPMS